MNTSVCKEKNYKNTFTYGKLNYYLSTFYTIFIRCLLDVTWSYEHPVDV